MGFTNKKANKGRVDPKRVEKGTSAGGQFAPDKSGASNIPMAVAASVPTSPVKKGKLVVIAGPGGVGKDTIIKELLARRKDLKFPISTTTRAPREGETDGKDYTFVSQEEFNKTIEEDGFLEHATFGKNQYGTPKKELLQSLEEGSDVVTILELQGVEQIKKAYPESSIVFLTPPSMETLRERMSGRGDAEKDVENRMDIANKEMVKGPTLADYIVVSDDVDRTTDEILSFF
jgi:guanylate kinase